MYEKHVSVKSAVTGCDVTNFATTSQGFNVARLCQIREASLVALRKFSKNLRLLTCVDHSTRPIHHTRIQ